MSEHIHEDSFFCGGAVVKKVDDFFLECRARGRQMTGKRSKQSLVSSRIRKCGHGTGYFREQKGKG